MPGKRTDLISQRDVEVLDFIARFGVVPRSAVATWAATRRTTTITRETRLRKAGLIVVDRGFGNIGPLSTANAGRSSRLWTRRSCRRHRSRSVFCATKRRSPTWRRGWKGGGEQLLSERQILAHERAAGDRVLSAALSGGRFHRADLVRVDGSGNALEAIEVELTAKKKDRLDEVLRAWRRVVGQEAVGGVTYRCPPQTRRLVERAVERTKTGGVVSVVGLEDERALESAAVGG